MIPCFEPTVDWHGYSILVALKDLVGLLVSFVEILGPPPTLWADIGFSFDGLGCAGLHWAWQ